MWSWFIVKTFIKLHIKELVWFEILLHDYHLDSSDPPGAPNAPTVTDIFKDNCTVRWEVPSFNGGAPVTGYWLERRVTSSNLWVNVQSFAIKDTFYKDIKLLEGNEFEYRVSAENKVGKGEPSPPSRPFLAKDPFGK